MSYKDVADTLINSINYHISVKEEKNIRRRVYDALNVLISAGVIQKNGKIVTNQAPMLPRKRTAEEILTVKHQRIAIEAKRKILREQAKKLSAVSNLIARNKGKSADSA
jgi:hypothetical protein